jgi:hypothetical protein
MKAIWHMRADRENESEIVADQESDHMRADRENESKLRRFG